MNRFASMLTIALLTAGFGASALAQNTDKSKTTSTTKATTPSSKTPRHQAAVGEVRNWKAIDKNHDNLIEPDEMEAYLQQGKTKAKQ